MQKMDENKTVEMTKSDETYEVSPIVLDSVLEIANSSNSEKYSAIKWHGMDLIIRHVISYDEMSAFVKAVVDACFNEETGEYEPQNRDFMYKYGEILFYTNVELPKETTEAYDVVYALDLNDYIGRHADQHQLADIQSAISEAIDYRLEQNLDALKAELRKFENVFVELGDTMSSIDPDEIKKTMASIAEHGKLDEGAIVKALFPKGADDNEG
jgi:hypothetical protein